ncbi:TPA: replication initiation protein [Klebsiella pneumoniae]|nr:replication initiation protein [Klebsiella pneumoniae]HBZ1418918.1 replication initiation protein [Klebsiella pneumoniae]
MQGCLHSAFSGNYHLESNPERHDKAPLVTDLEELVLKLCACYG